MPEKETSIALRNVSHNDRFVRAVYTATHPISRYFNVSIDGTERIPESGGVMLVGNHALMGVDTWALLPELMRHIDRVPRGMALRKLFEVPLLNHALERVGMVPGTRASAVELLQREELVLTYPGGARDSLKDRSERYQIKWHGRRGFAHVALRAQRPVQPLVGAGPDECFHMLNERGILPLRGLAGHKVKVPLFIPIARRIPFAYLVGDLIHPPKVDPDTCPERYEKLVTEFAHDVEHTTQNLLTEHARHYTCAIAPATSRTSSLRHLLTSSLLGTTS